MLLLNDDILGLVTTKADTQKNYKIRIGLYSCWEKNKRISYILCTLENRLCCLQSFK